MMEFKDNKPIYRQIVEFAFNRMIDGSWVPDEMIPSVRELTADLGVNSRTVLKALDELQDLELIESRRGMGFMLVGDAVEKVRGLRRRDFFESTIPDIISEMNILGISAAEVAALLSASCKK